MRYAIVEEPNDMYGMRSYGIYRAGDEPSWPKLTWKSSGRNTAALILGSIMSTYLFSLLVFAMVSDSYRSDSEMVAGTIGLLGLLAVSLSFVVNSRYVRNKLNGNKRIVNFTMNRFTGREAGRNGDGIIERIIYIHSNDAYAYHAEAALDSWLDINYAYENMLITPESRRAELNKITEYLTGVMNEMDGNIAIARDIDEGVLSDTVDMSMKWIKDTL